MSESTATAEVVDDVTENGPAEDQSPAGDDEIHAGGDDEGRGAESNDEGADALSDKGKQALDRMKSKWHAEREKRRDAERRLAGATGGDEADDRQRPRAAG